MSTVAWKCLCCSEESTGFGICDEALEGAVCRECAADLRQAEHALKSRGMRGIYHGPCPDYPNGKDKP